MTSTVVADGASLSCAANDRPLDSDPSGAEAALPGITAVVSWPGAGR